MMGHFIVERFAMDQKAGAQISRKAFIQSAAILLALMLIAGILTLVVPAGSYTRVEEDGRQLIVPDTYKQQPRPAYPVWRWITAPLEVLWGPDGMTVIVIILFILFVGVSFAVMDRTGILRSTIGALVRRFRQRKYILLLIISLFFMLLGAFFGIFEEVVPLVPLIVALSYSLGWDSLTGLGMSVLATNMGFSAAIANPFTIGIAQRLADLPLFSGAWLRLLVFLVVYGLFALFLVRYARRIDTNPSASLVYAEDEQERLKEVALEESEHTPHLARGMRWFISFLVLVLGVLLAAPFVPALSDLSLPLVGVLFLIGGLGAGRLAGARGGEIWRAAWDGLTGIAPGIPLILMAMSVKHIVASGGILDTILHSAATLLSGTSPLLSAGLILLLTLLIEVFVASGSAKAFLLMPILIPLADLVGVTRQTTVLAYAFGDGFSNMAYPTNAVLLISLGLTVVSYPKWIRWTAKLWLWVLLAALLALALSVAIGYGPF
jgi:uncharacterized ion transporter superfamily protein YfcC